MNFLQKLENLTDLKIIKKFKNFNIVYMLRRVVLAISERAINVEKHFSE